MAISDNILEVMKKIRVEKKNGSTATGDDLQLKAVAAITKGSSSNEWEQYMNIFANDASELAKLKVEDDASADAAKRNLSRSYLVGNGNCGAETTGYILYYGVEDNLDDFTPNS